MQERYRKKKRFAFKNESRVCALHERGFLVGNGLFIAHEWTWKRYILWKPNKGSTVTCWNQFGS